MTEQYADDRAELLAYYKQLLDYQEGGFDAAERADYDTAIQIWTAILSDEVMRDFFNTDPEALKEIAWNLALAYWGNGDEQMAGTIFSQWGFQPGEYLAAIEQARQ
jgi:hypothetical protein